MDVMVHPPKDAESISALEKKVACLHAEAVLLYIKKLPCSTAQKIELIDALKGKGLPH